MAVLSKPFGTAISAFCVWLQLAICKLNPHFSRNAKIIVAGGIFGIFCVSPACIFGIFWIFVSCSCEVWHASVSYFLGPVLCSFAPSHSIFDWSVKLAVHLLFCLLSYPFYVQCRKVSIVLWVSRMCCYFWSRWWSGESSKWQEVCCCYWCDVLELKAN